MSDVSDIVVWSVDRSWGNVRADADGNMFPSDNRKYHADRGDSTAKCNPYLPLNCLSHPIYGQDLGVMASEVDRADLCRRCVPIQPCQESPDTEIATSPEVE
ncbi:hypothetical protein [Microbacterium sp. Leaf320]|uniref:hypothetical protein n=1 Tax=Microbacterium sp. Leaf320 TaxID=1736334 RepID=UPI0006F3679A|nr:hypothetical protein [Microbacterium sp. Leaf320]KQQ65205.1 hypothetical protein ASF63_14705 [Microbacterium sp. Leaf320]